MGFFDKLKNGLGKTKESFSDKLNNVFSTRLSAGNYMYEKYGIKIFGQNIDEHGSGGSVESKEKYKYEFIWR